MTTRLRCLLLDDELPGLTYLKMICEQLPEVEVVKSFNSAQKLLNEFSQLDADLCIMDIEMPGINGLELAALLQGKPVIFTTAYKEFAAEAFDLDAIDYIRKPVTKERLQQAIQKALKQIEQKTESRKFVQLNTDKGKLLLFFDQICYIQTSESDSRDKVVLMDNGVFITLKNISFEKLATLLPADSFCRINKKQVLALSRVQFYSHQEITTTISESDKTLVMQLNESYRPEFIKKVKP